MYERDQAGNTKVYVWLDGLPLARIDNDAQIYYYHVDHLGTPQAMTDAAGTTMWKADYEPFGKATVKVGTIENNLRFPGQYYDRETELHYNYFRDYDPGTGRYMEADPIGLEGGTNLYIYVSANPLKFIDPDGLQTVVTDMGAGTTTFNPAPYPGAPITIPTRNDVVRSAQPGATDPYATPDTNWIPEGTRSRAYGPDGSYIDTGDSRGRDIHGGGSRLRDPFASNQGWAPTQGCTRGQNDDVRRLGEAIADFKRHHPGVPVPYTRR